MIHPLFCDFSFCVFFIEIYELVQGVRVRYLLFLSFPRSSIPEAFGKGVVIDFQLRYLKIINHLKYSKYLGNLFFKYFPVIQFQKYVL